MYVKTPGIDEFLRTFARADVQKSVAEGERERLTLVKKFPLSEWGTLPLERYAYGQGRGNSQDTFSWALENGTKNLALLANHGSRAFKIYFRKKDARWWYEGDYADEETAWQSIRYMYQQAFARAKAGRWNAIDELHTSRHGANALLKTLICYFPDDLLPITSTNHIAHFLIALGVVDFEKKAQNVVNLNRLLLFKLRAIVGAEGNWSNGELARLLYAWAPPMDDGSELDENWDEEAEAASGASLGEALAGGIDERLFEKIAASLEHKGQVILYGPPGTGKTFAANAFAQRWLDGESSLVVRDEGEDSAASARSWLIVSNQVNGSWDKLFDDGVAVFRGGKLKANFKAASVGDLVFGYTNAPKQRVEGVARVSRAMFLDDGGEHCIELAPVARVKRGVSFDDIQKHRVLGKSEAVRSNMRGTLFALTEKEADALRGLLEKREPGLASAFLRQEAKEDAGIRLVRLTFHPSYSYEDFVEGFKPDLSVAGNVVLKLKDGIFKRVCREADANRGRKYLILIDEINRANVAKVFGEVITVIEKDKRDLSVELPQSNEQFCVPPNVFLIGTMNTADRGIKALDLAMRRRFSFIEMQPDAELLAGAVIEGGLDLGALLEHLNGKLVRAGNRDKQIGHAFFMEGGKPVRDLVGFGRVFRHEVLPLLQEYCFDRFTDLAGFVGNEIVDIDGDCFFEERLADDGKLVAALVKVIGDGRGA